MQKLICIKLGSSIQNGEIYRSLSNPVLKKTSRWICFSNKMNGSFRI